MKWLAENRDHRGSECLIWPFGRNSAGYAIYDRDGKMFYVHRYMCTWRHGSPPDRHQAAHSCGRGHEGCVNPEHLSWKTARANQLDRRKHGTIARGQGVRKLTEAQAIEIRTSRELPTILAARFGCTEATVRQIRTGKTWKIFTAGQSPTGQNA